MSRYDRMRPCETLLRVAWLAFLSIGLAPLSAEAVGQQSPRAGERIPTVATPGTSMLGITLTASRSQLTAGGTIGVIGLLTNLSKDSTLYLTQGTVFLTQAPELEGPMAGMRAWTAYFPGESQGVWVRDTFTRYADDSIIVALKPGESVEVGWTPVRNSVLADSQATVFTFLRQTKEQILNEFRFLFFTPGDYQMAIAAKYWTDPRRSKLGYHTANQTIAVHVAAPQFVILFGAALGGLIAYLIFPSRRTVDIETEHQGTPIGNVSRVARLVVRVQKSTASALGAMLWSAIATILLSRLADTQFLVKVTVADFWGAIAVGLVAQYAGAKWLARLIGEPNVDKENKPAPDAATNSRRDNADVPAIPPPKVQPSS